MAYYFEELEWSQLEEAEQQNHMIHLGRFLTNSHDYLNMNWPSIPPPASKEIVKNIPEITIDTKGKNCPICLDEFKLQEKAKKLPCEHFFHSTCIIIWLNKTNSCPFCRLELPTDDKRYEQFKKEKKTMKDRLEELEMLFNI